MRRAFLIIAFFALPARAASPYDVDPLVDGAALAGTYGLLLFLEAGAKPSLAGGITCADRTASGRCDPDSLNALDRQVVGNRSRGWTIASDVAAGASYAAPLIAEIIDVVSSGSVAPANEVWTDAVVMAEAIGVATLATHVIKMAVRRPRPTQYREDAYVGSVEHQLSFPSGHTASAAAAATSYVTTFALRHPDSPWRYAVIGAGVVVTGVTGYGRIGGGWHFYTDVGAGAVLGVAAGILVPALHRSNVVLTPTLVPSAIGPAQGLALVGTY
jgi:membrane-associated phospholipid phosphatase